MLYALQEYGYYAATPMRLAARSHPRRVRSSPLNPAAEQRAGPPACYAASDLFANVTRRYGKPDWTHRQRRPSTAGRCGCGQTVGLVLALVPADPLRPRPLRPAPRRPASSIRPVLIVAPLSGHYATLLRGTVEAFLPDHEVYITDWIERPRGAAARGPLRLPRLYRPHPHHAGRDRARAHVVAVCQPGPPVLAARRLMAEDKDPDRPASMTFMGSPIDARLAPPPPTGWPRNGPSPGSQSNMIATPCRRPIRARCAGSIRASSSSTASCR